MLFILAFLLAQESPDSLVVHLASDDPETRLKAEEELLRMGSRAAPALRAALRHSDPEVGTRAKACLERIELREELSPRLLAVPGLEERLRRSGASGWYQEFTNASRPMYPVKPYEHLVPDDLAHLAHGALRRHLEPDKVRLLIVYTGNLRLEAMRPEIEAFLHHERLDYRCDAVQALLSLRGPHLLEEADRLLKDPTPEIRSRAFSSLAHLRIHEAVPLMLKVQPDGVLKGTGYESGLLKLGADIPTPCLEKMSDDPAVDHHERNSAAMHLAYFGGPNLIPHMRRLLRWTRQDPNTADQALLHLGTWGDQESIPRIEAMIQHEHLWGDNPRSAFGALYHLGAQSSVPILLKLAESGNGFALELLVRIGNREVIPDLRKQLGRLTGDVIPTGPLPGVIIALGELGDRSSLPALRGLLEHKDSRFREAAATALALLQDADSVKILRELKAEAAQARKIWPALGADDSPDSLASRETWGQARGPSQLAPLGRDTQDFLLQSTPPLGARAFAIVTSGISPETLHSELHGGWLRVPNVIVAASLVRLGRREGLMPLLDARRPIFSLNRLRKPDLFKTLDEKPTAVRGYATFEELHRRLAREAGLPLEGPASGSPASQRWTRVHTALEKWGKPPSIALGFELLEDDHWGIVLEEDRLRVLPLVQALTFWKEWAASSLK